MMNWNAKLAAYLHDPPEKAFDFSQAHANRAKTYALAFGLQDADLPTKSPDWSASAADRFVFPVAGKVSEKETKFFHPLSGTEAFSSESFPEAGDAHTFVSDAIPCFKGGKDQTVFWLAWRLWMEYAATHHEGLNKGAGSIPYLPADTRIPDHSIWQHCSITSAIESTRGEDGKLHPAFLMFQLGPVQDFIAQARSTRDLWSGSYMVSWLMAHAIKKVAEDCGPDCLIFPSLRGQPLYDWLNKDKLDSAKYADVGGAESKSYWKAIIEPQSRDFEESVLIANLPNRFLAVVPASFDPACVAEALKSEWKTVAAACFKWLSENGAVPQQELWDFQVANFWQTTWQLWAWPKKCRNALQLYENIPAGKDPALRQAYDVAMAITDGDRDDRCYRDENGNKSRLGDLDPGWAWSANYQILQHKLDARRQTRDFAAWQGRANAVKDDYSGREESVIDDKWLEAARSSRNLSFLFRKDDERLGAVNLVKRVWHKAYLAAEQRNLKPASASFDSVPAVAAASWREKVFKQLKKSGRAWQAVLDFQNAVRECADYLDFELPKTDLEGAWLSRVDAGVLQESFWNKLCTSEASREKAEKAGKALKALIKEANSGSPGRYFAVLAMDGDEIGKWLAGEKSPEVRKVLAPTAVEYFSKTDAGRKWLDSRRPLSPSWHLQFSEALSNFSLYCARRIVEYHQGRLIYAGGDDVLAMLPADEAIACANGLQNAFQGSVICATYPEFMEAPKGFVRLAEEYRGRFEPSWPLLVPGPEATISAGIAIAHIREPLQDVVESAHDALGAAKGDYDRNALAVNLFKRSGEIVKWGVNFGSAAFPLLEFMREHYRVPAGEPDREKPIHGKFPYRVAELLRPYAVESSSGADDMTGVYGAKMNQSLLDIAIAELKWAIKQQCEKEVRDALEGLCGDYARELRDKNRPLADLWNVFAVEAFIARQGE